ncbi:MAG: hypothetical protein OXE99_12600 [Cellvibrionales bacterium]|nr:hypothetical protein [Cellvibrionales bacterium]
MKFLALASLVLTFSLTGCTIESFTFNGDEVIKNNEVQEQNLPNFPF